MAGEFLLRGLNISFPAVDHGVDLYVEKHVAIQVKSTGLRTNHVTPDGAYWFGLRQGPIITGNNTIKRRPPRVFSEQCDFLVLVGIQPRHYWVVPAAELDLVQCAVVNLAEPKWPVVDEGEIKRLYGEPITTGDDVIGRSSRSVPHARGSEGLTQTEVASIVGINQMTVSQVIRGTYKPPRRNLSRRIRPYEGRWDLVEKALNTIEEAQAIAADPQKVLQEVET